jgi:hypothetical protein
MTWKTLVLLGAALATASAASAQSNETKPPADAAAAPAAKKRQRVVSDLSGFELLDPAKLKDKPMVSGATRSLFSPKPPVLLAPHLARLHGASPVFAWRHNAKRYHVALSDEAGRELHAADVEGLRYEWPQGAPRLEDGATYSWSVKPLDPAGTASSAGIVIVTKAERAEIDRALTAVKIKDAYSQSLARGAAFTDKRVWYDALGVYTDLIARFPDRPQAYEQRATLYAQLPTLQEAADEDFAQADALTKAR